MVSKALKPRKEPGQDRSRATVDAILEAAARVLIEKGYAGATTNHIAETAGVSIGSLYQYFPNKEAILFRLMDLHMIESHVRIDDLVKEMEAKQRLQQEHICALVEAMVDLHRNDPGLHRVLFEEMPHTKSFWDKYREVESSMAGRLEKLMAKTPEVRKKDLGASSRLIVRTIESLTHYHVISGFDDLDDERFIEETSDLLRRYIFD